MADKDQKTHAPSGKRLADARGRGDLPTAPEMRHAAIFIGALIVTGSLGVHAFERLATLIVRLWERADDFTLAPDGVQSIVTGLFAAVATALAPLFAVLVVLAILAPLTAGMPTIAFSRIAPKFNKVNPVAGFKRIYTVAAMVEFAKTLAKLGVVIAAVVWVAWPHATALDTLVGADPAEVGRAASGVVAAVLRAVAMAVGVIAAADLIYQRRKWIAKLRMSLQELKDEHKDSEGDPKIKAKIRAIAMQRSRRRMMAAVPEASVIITNPTHYAIALKYEHGKTGAPIVVAKGVDTLALKIREVATAAGVPLVENRPLARALYASAEIDRPIPIEHYAAVAEIIGYVMRLAKRKKA
ncbi:flagellar type III secretion system protein FlhB [Sphingomonas sp.]|uniref:EscU/YscU/HrcU family type III secretion system export apparatus switch protein n=1 Tax=Sphingomonas sp. TaxID=28214 RepID=UPI002ED87701